MARGRMISASTWKSEQLARFSLRHRLLWLGIVTTADDQGRGLAHPGLVRSTVFPLDDIGLGEIEEGMRAFADAGMLELYQADGKALYQLVNWWEHQSGMTWAQPSEYPPPAGWQDRIRKRQGNTVLADGWDDDGGYSDPTMAPPRDHVETNVSSAPNITESNITETNLIAPSGEITPAMQGYESLIGLFDSEEDIYTLKALERDVGSDTMCEVISWAAKKGANFTAILTAARNWRGNGRSPPNDTGPPAPEITPEQAAAWETAMHTTPKWIAG